MDDLLNCCTASLAKFFGIQIRFSDDLNWYNPRFEWDVVGAVNFARGSQYSEREFWDAIPSDFWEEIPKSEICDQLIEKCVSLVGESRVVIATACTLDDFSLAYKVRWIKKHLPKFMHRQWSITPVKALATAPGKLLIDDRWDNCQGVAEMGGKYICWPKPWNPLRSQSDSAVDFLEESLAKFDFEAV